MTITTVEEQQAYNKEICTVCQSRRFQHLNAVLCSEQNSDTSQMMAELLAIRADIAAIKLFVDNLEAAIKASPMGKVLMG